MGEGAEHVFQALVGALERYNVQVLFHAKGHQLFFCFRRIGGFQFPFIGIELAQSGKAGYTSLQPLSFQCFLKLYTNDGFAVPGLQIFKVVVGNEISLINDDNPVAYRFYLLKDMG